MISYAKIEWEISQLRGLVRQSMSLSLFYLLLYIGLQLYFAMANIHYGFFPTMAIFLSVANNTSLFDDGKSMAMRRLLPSLPFTRSQLYWGRTGNKLLVWLGALVIAYLISWLLNGWMGTKPSLTVVLLGVSLSFLVLSIENLVMHLSYRIGRMIRGGLLGALMSLHMSSGSFFIGQILNIDPTGWYTAVICFGLGLGLLVLNARIYQRKAL